MRHIVLANQKGGTGKTTTAVNLAACLAECGRKVLLIDLDPQRSASNWYAITDAGEGLLDMLDGRRRLVDLVWESDVPGVDVIPSCKTLANYELRLSHGEDAEARLQAEVEALPADVWDYLIIDAPPTLGLLTLNALTAAREVLVPVEARAMALSGLGDLIQTVEKARKKSNPALTIAGILPCCVNRTRLAADVVARLRRDHAGMVYQTVIRENVRLAESWSYKQPITIYDPTSNGAADYRALAAEVIAQEDTHNGQA